MASSAVAKKVAVIGGGICGSSWALLFASAGYRTVIHDIKPSQLSTCMKTIEKNIRLLETNGAMRGSLSVDQQLSLIETSHSLEDACHGATFISENIPERADQKRSLFERIADFTVIDRDCVIASSTSTMPMSTLTGHLAEESGCERRKQFASQTIVAHNANPVFFLGAVEVVPAPYTRPAITTACQEILREIGQIPITLEKEWPGFALNRIQYAVVNEAWNLVNSGVVSPEGVDAILTDGLGPRWAFFGPWEIADLNGPGGIRSYFEHYGAAMKRVSDTFAPAPRMSPDCATNVKLESLARKRVPLENIEKLYHLRDRYLMEVYKLKRNIDKQQFYDEVNVGSCNDEK